MQDRNKTDRNLCEECRAIADSITDLFYALDEDLRITFWNRTCEQATGISAEHALGRLFSEVLPSQDGPGVKEFYCRVCETGEPESMISVLGDGEHGRHYEIAAYRSRRGISAIARDITERRLADEQLRGKNRLLNAILQAIPDSVYFKDRSGRYLFVNKVYERLMGVHAGDVAGKTSGDLLPPGLRESAIASDRDVLDRGLIYRGEQEMNTPEGTMVFDTVKIPLVDDHGAVTGLVGISRDITERMEAVRSFREIEEIFNLFMEYSPVYVFFKDDQIRSVKLSRNYETMLGKPIEDLLGKSMYDLFPSELAKSMVADDRRILREGKPIEVEEELNGRIYQTVKFPIASGDKPHMLAGFTIDITERKQAEEALKESAFRLNSLLDNLQDGVLFEDHDRKILFVNRKFCALFGIPAPPESLIGADCESAAESSRTMFDDAGAFVSLIEELISRGLPVSGEELRLTDGRVFERDYMPIVAAEQHRGNLWKYRDITERKRDEEKIRTYSGDLERLLLISRELTSTTDLRTLYRVIVEAPRELLGLDFSTVMMLDGGGRGLLIEDSIGFPETMIGRFILMEGQGLSTWVVRNKRPDVVVDFASERRFEVPAVVREMNIRSSLCVPMMAEDEAIGVLIGHTLVSREFTDHEISLYQSIANQAAVAVRNAMHIEALRKGEKHLQDITSHLAEGLYVIDRSGRITFMNDEAERLLGWTMDELNKGGAHRLFHDRKADGTPLPAAACSVHNVVHTGKRFVSDEEVFVRKDGTVFPVSVVSGPVVEDGKIVASITAFRDITVMKQLEQDALKTQKLESVGILAGGIAHDFNNLLTAIMGNISLCRLHVRANDKMARLLDEAEHASVQAKDLSYRLLTFSKGGEPLKKVLRVAEFLRDAVALPLSGSSVSAEFSLHGDLPPVEADEGQMKQVVNNLVMNAREAMPAGGLLRVAAETVVVKGEDLLPLHPGRYVKISFTDQGPGIPPENLQKVFDPYFSTKELGSRKGSGLGLAICHSIVSKHGGSITVDSFPGKGATFHVYLPARETTSADRGTVPEAVREPGQKGRILVMDDEERVRTVVTEIFRHLEYEVECAPDGADAVIRYRRAQEAGLAFDLVLLDLTVPGGTGGLDTLDKLRSLDPKVRAVVMSGYADDPIVKGYGAYGFAGAIAKPFNIEDLSRSIGHLLAPPAGVDGP